MGGITQSLAGRASLLTLLPFSLAELQTVARPPATIDSLLQGGLFPPIHDRAITSADWLQDYVATYVERDVRQILRIQDLTSFQRFLVLCGIGNKVRRHGCQRLLRRLGLLARPTRPRHSAPLAHLRRRYPANPRPWHRPPLVRPRPTARRTRGIERSLTIAHYQDCPLTPAWVMGSGAPCRGYRSTTR